MQYLPPTEVIARKRQTCQADFTSSLFHQGVEALALQSPGNSFGNQNLLHYNLIACESLWR